jgi:hypothetical protein
MIFNINRKLRRMRWARMCQAGERREMSKVLMEKPAGTWNFGKHSCR